MKFNVAESDVIFEQRNWPFKSMEVGDIVQFEIEDYDERLRCQRQAHIFGSGANRKFTTRTIGNVLYVKRIK